MHLLVPPSAGGPSCPSVQDDHQDNGDFKAEGMAHKRDLINNRLPTQSWRITSKKTYEQLPEDIENQEPQTTSYRTDEERPQRTAVSNIIIIC